VAVERNQLLQAQSTTHAATRDQHQHANVNTFHAPSRDEEGDALLLLASECLRNGLLEIFKLKALVNLIGLPSPLSGCLIRSVHIIVYTG